MNKEQILDFLVLLRAKPTTDQPRAGWVLSNCPLGWWRHDNGKSNPQAFGVRIEAGDSFCSCFSCGFHGNQAYLIEVMRQLNKATPMLEGVKFGDAFDLVIAAENDVELDFGGPGIEDVLFGNQDGDDNHVFPEDWLESFAPAWSIKWAREYLLSREVPHEICLMLDLRADTKFKRVCCPIRDFKGRLRGLHGRNVNPEVTARYHLYKHANKKNPIVWLGETWLDVTRPIVVVEGFFDVASVMRVYRNVVCPLYVNPSIPKIMRMSDALSWVTLLDQGKGGGVGRTKISKALPGHHVTHLQLTAQKDPGASSISELVAVLSDHVELDDLVT